MAIYQQQSVESIQQARSYRPASDSSPETSRCGLQMLADVLDNKQLRCGPVHNADADSRIKHEIISSGVTPTC
jgi:hypothetical protein